MLSSITCTDNSGKSFKAGRTLLQTLFFFLLATQINFSQWYQQNSGTTKNLNAIKFIDANNGFAVGDSGTILFTSDGGGNWINQTSGTMIGLRDVIFNNTTGWAIGGNTEADWYNADSSIILRTSDKGINWTIEPAGLGYGCFYDCNFSDENNGTIVGCKKDSEYWYGEPVILRTTDGGQNWLEKTLPSHNALLNIPSVYFVNEDLGWISETVGSQYRGPQISKTTDSGINWQIQFTRHTGYIAYLKSIKFNDEYSGFAVGNSWGDGRRITGLLFFTTDGGTNWINADTSFYPVLLHSINDIYLTGSNTAVAVGDSGDILQVTYSIGGWTEQISNTDSALNGVCFVDNLTGWVVGDGGTILHTTNGGVTFTENEIALPNEFLLSQNYPNPFNPSTTIKYSVPELSKVKLVLYNLLGEEVATILNEEKNAGNYEVEFIAQNIPSGVYFYQMKAGKFIQTIKMLLIK